MCLTGRAELNLYNARRTKSSLAIMQILLQRLLGGAPLARSLASAGEAARPVKRSAEGGPLNARHKWRASTTPKNVKATSVEINLGSPKSQDIARPSSCHCYVIILICFYF